MKKLRTKERKAYKYKKAPLLDQRRPFYKKIYFKLMRLIS